jgi:hypothetical protein
MSCLSLCTILTLAGGFAAGCDGGVSVNETGKHAGGLHGGGQGDSDDSGTTMTPGWDWLDGVWNVYGVQTDPEPAESVNYTPYRFVVDGDGVSVVHPGFNVKTQVTVEPFGISMKYGGHEAYGDGSYTYACEILLDTKVSDTQLTGIFTDNVTMYDADGNVTDSYQFTVIEDFRKVETLDASVSQGLTLLGKATPLNDGQYSVNVRVAGDYAYVAHYADGLLVYNVSDPTVPAMVASAPASAGYWNDVKLYEKDGQRFALMASSREGLVVVDVTDPLAPTQVATLFPTGENVHTLAVEGDYAYLATMGPRGQYGSLDIVDIHDPLNPVELGSWSSQESGGSFVHDLYVRDGIAYLCTWEGGLALVDVSDPTAPTMVGQVDYDTDMTSHSVWVTDAPGRLVALEGGENWDTHLRVIDVDPASPEYLTVLGELALPPQVSIHNIMMGEGTTALIAWYQYGVRLVDIADPTNPNFVGWANTWDPADSRSGQLFFEGAVGVDYVDGKVYVADMWDDLEVYGWD